MAFHPGGNGRFFVHYRDTEGDTVLAEYRVSDDPDQADPDAVGIVLTDRNPPPTTTVAWSSSGRMACCISLWATVVVAVTRSGTGRTRTRCWPRCSASMSLGGAGTQSPRQPPSPMAAALPDLGDEGCATLRFWFDDGLIYIGDVGQNAFEEIDVAPADAPGLNYGWPITEGLHCFAILRWTVMPRASPCR